MARRHKGKWVAAYPVIIVVERGSVFGDEQEGRSTHIPKTPKTSPWVQEDNKRSPAKPRTGITRATTRRA